MSDRIQVDEISGDVYASRESTEPLHCTGCGERIGLEAFSVGPDGDAAHDRCATAVS